MTSTFKIVNGDFVINAANGRPVLVSDTDKLTQDVEEILSVEAPAGAGLEELIGSIDDVAGDAARRINDALLNMQREQRRIQLAQRSRQELLARVVRVNVFHAKTTSNTPARTAYSIQVSVVSAANQSSTATAPLIGV